MTQPYRLSHALALYRYSDNYVNSVFGTIVSPISIPNSLTSSSELAPISNNKSLISGTASFPVLKCLGILETIPTIISPFLF